MRPMLFAFAVIIGVAILSNVALNNVGYSAGEQGAGSAVRLN